MSVLKMLAYLTVAQVAEEINVKEATVRGWIFRREKLQVVRFGRAIRIPRASIEEFIASNTTPPARARG